MRGLATVVLLAFVALAAPAQQNDKCVPVLQLQNPKSITFAWCASAPALQNDQEITITAGSVIPAKVVRVVQPPGLPIHADVEITADLDQETLYALAHGKTAVVTVGDASATAEIVSQIAADNHLDYEWSVGPATKGDEDGDDQEDEGNGDGNAVVGILQQGEASGDGDEAGALRFRYAADYARGGFFGRSSKGLLQTTAALTIDTTDQEESDFIDNNRLAVGLQATGLSLGRLWMHGNAGIEARVEKGFHHSNRNTDIVAKLSGWVPVARSVTLFPQDGQVVIAAPLSFTASYGYRGKKVDDVTSNGRVFEATALYHLYLFSQYRVDFSGTLTHSDVNDLPAGTPRTQRMYKATVAYLANREKGFEVLTSIENGSFGVMLQEVRQYFVGVAISKLNFNGGTN